MLKRYGYDNKTLAALKPLTNHLYKNEDHFMKAVNGKTRAFEDASDALALKEHSTTYTLLRSDILFDVGKSLNPLIDVGQIEGGFIQGVGYVPLEELLLQGPDQAPRQGHPKEGLTSTNTWNYKPTGTKSIPIDLRVKLVNNSGCDLQHPGPKLDIAAVKSSKGIGEPPLVLGNSVFFAIKQAILAFYKDQGYDGWVEMDAPATVQQIQSACRVARDDLKL